MYAILCSLEVFNYHGRPRIMHNNDPSKQASLIMAQARLAGSWPGSSVHML